MSNKNKAVMLTKDTLYFKKGDIMKYLFHEEDSGETWYLLETTKRNVDRSKEKYEEFVTRDSFTFI